MNRDRQQENLGVTEDEAQILLGVIDDLLANDESPYGDEERNLLASIREKLLSIS